MRDGKIESTDRQNRQQHKYNDDAKSTSALNYMCPPVFEFEAADGASVLGLEPGHDAGLVVDVRTRQFRDGFVLAVVLGANGAAAGVRVTVA